jgi:hypothetical protein
MRSEATPHRCIDAAARCDCPRSGLKDDRYFKVDGLRVVTISGRQYGQWSSEADRCSVETPCYAMKFSMVLAKAAGELEWSTDQRKSSCYSVWDEYPPKGMELNLLLWLPEEWYLAVEEHRECRQEHCYPNYVLQSSIRRSW